MEKFGRKTPDLDEFQYGDHDVDCHCGITASHRISHTSANPGRKFFGCRNYKSKVLYLWSIMQAEIPFFTNSDCDVNSSSM
ncbi:hypothetical protein LINPERHAP2_LOCUS24801 [Linum perenne]